MKRFLALLLTLVMLVSVCGLQAFAADGDTPADTGDELVVYTRSGATRTFHVGDTFSYTYWFRLTTKGSSVNKITGHVLYDSQCLTVNADGCKFPNMTSPSTKNNAGDFEFHDTFTTSQGGEFATTSPQTMANISFTVTRGGTAYLTTLLEELEIRKSNGDKSQLVTNFKNKSWSPTMYSTFDYLQDEKPSLASTPLSASSDVAWFYAVDAETGAPIPAGVTFELTGTSDNGKHIERTAVSDAYGFVGFGTVPYGKSYYIQTRTASDASVAYIIKDGARILPDVENGKLRLDHTLHYKTADPSELRSITVTFEWTNEQIAPDEVYTKDRPTSVYMELSRNNDAVVVAHHSSDPEDGQAVFDNLPIHDDNGNEITYVLTTSTLQHYDAQITRTDTSISSISMTTPGRRPAPNPPARWTAPSSPCARTAARQTVSCCPRPGTSWPIPATRPPARRRAMSAICARSAPTGIRRRSPHSAMTGATGMSISRRPPTPTVSSTARACAAARWRRMPFRAKTTSTP